MHHYRFLVQQEELVLVHEENMKLKRQLSQGEDT
jgi:hypothetical protein